MRSASKGIISNRRGYGNAQSCRADQLPIRIHLAKVRLKLRTRVPPLSGRGTGQKVRLRPESFADHYSQTRQFYISQTPPEQRHIASASPASDDLSKEATARGFVGRRVPAASLLATISPHCHSFKTSALPMTWMKVFLPCRVKTVCPPSSRNSASCVSGGPSRP
jgi:hypothetical protein